MEQTAHSHGATSSAGATQTDAKVRAKDDPSDALAFSVFALTAVGAVGFFLAILILVLA